MGVSSRSEEGAAAYKRQRQSGNTFFAVRRYASVPNFRNAELAITRKYFVDFMEAGKRNLRKPEIPYSEEIYHDFALNQA